MGDRGTARLRARRQNKVMQAWAEGEFINDLGQILANDELLADALTRMALESCVGGALDPGFEVSMAVLFDGVNYLEGEPLRLSHAAVRPGDVTHFNAVPWQADFLACRWEELDGPWPRWLGWWPAHAPDDVYPTLGAAEMVPWARGMSDDFQDMIDKWDRLGFVIDRGGRPERRSSSSKSATRRPSVPNHNAGISSGPPLRPDLLPPSRRRGGGLRWGGESRDHPQAQCLWQAPSAQADPISSPRRGGGLRWGGARAVTIPQAQCRQQPPPATDPISSPRRGGGLRWGGESHDHLPSPMPTATTSSHRSNLLPPSRGRIKVGGREP